MLQLNKSGIRVARYLTELPPRELLEKTLHESIRRARERLAIAKQGLPADDKAAVPPLTGMARSKKTSRR